MRNLIYLFISLLIIATSCNSNPFNEYDENLIYINNLKGKVKSVKSETYRATDIFGEIVKEGLVSPFFDLSNTLTTIFSPNSTFEFAENGLTTSSTISKYNFTYSLKQIYDKKWNIIEEHFIIDDNEIIGKYNTVDGKIVSATSYDIEGRVESSNEFLYENNLIKEVIKKNNDEKIVSKILYNYEDKNQIESIYGESGKLQQKNKKDIYGRYLEVGIPGDIKIINYEGKNPIPFELFRYEDNQIVGKFEITLDDHKNISEIKDIDINDEFETLYKYTYKYDKRGNWIERIKYENNNLKYITERTIEYY